MNAAGSRAQWGTGNAPTGKPALNQELGSCIS